MPGTEVILACDHARYWQDEHHAPPSGERIYCYACNDMREVIGRPGMYVARCHDCHYHKTYVTDVGVAKGVKRHLRLHPGHRTNVARIGSSEAVDLSLMMQDETLF